MNRANPVTRLGLLEVSALAQTYISQCQYVPTTNRIWKAIQPRRQYGRFDCKDIVHKISTRCGMRIRLNEKGPSLTQRLRQHRAQQLRDVFTYVFPITPTGGLVLCPRWLPARTLSDCWFKCASARGGWFNSRTIQVTLSMKLHPHWHRRLGALCSKMNRFFLHVERSGDLWWAVEVRKGRGYTFRAEKVRLSKREVQENQIDALEPLPPDAHVLGFDESGGTGPTG